MFGGSAANNKQTDTVVTQGNGVPGNPTVSGPGAPNGGVAGVGQPVGVQQPQRGWQQPPGQMQQPNLMPVDTGRGAQQMPGGPVQQPINTGVPVGQATPNVTIPRDSNMLTQTGGFAQGQPLAQTTRPDWGNENQYLQAPGRQQFTQPQHQSDVINTSGPPSQIPPPPPPANLSPGLTGQPQMNAPVGGAPAQPTPVQPISVNEVSPSPNLQLGTPLNPPSSPVNGVGPRQ
jgi:hypothetical protein